MSMASPGAAARGASAPDFDFIVTGAGTTAAALATLLVARKLAAPDRVALVAESPAVASPNHDSDWELRVFALSRASQRMLELCGVWQALPQGKVFPYARMCVWDQQTGVAAGELPGRGSLTFDCAELGEPNLGYIVEGRALQTLCRQAAQAAGIVSIDTHVTGIVADDDRIRVQLHDGRELAGALLIAADGVDSPTRRLLQIETAGHAYHQDALVAHIRTEKAHRSTAWQRFLRSGPLAFLPLPDGRSSIVWTLPHAEATRLRALTPPAFGAALTAACSGFLGACELTTSIASFPLKLQYAIDYVRPRAALVGDAAHAVHPLAGQGLNLGLLDCAALVDVLGGGSQGPGSRRVRAVAACGEYRSLRRYERWRRSENLLAATALDGLERLFASDHLAISRLRMAGLTGVSGLPFIKRQLAARALGLSGDLPRFLASHAAAGVVGN